MSADLFAVVLKGEGECQCLANVELRVFSGASPFALRDYGGQAGGRRHAATKAYENACSGVSVSADANALPMELRVFSGARLQAVLRLKFVD